MQLTGHTYIGHSPSAQGESSFFGMNPATGETLPQAFLESTEAEVQAACKEAEKAFEVYRETSGTEKAAFLEQIAEEIMALGEVLLERCHLETGLPMGRLTGERGRTVNQLRLFARVLREGSWVQARIDPTLPDRQPIPRPDLRQMQVPLGPVGIFGASNFPLAFSVAGGDTASALAAGCSIVVKGHPAHPGTSEWVGRAIISAAQKTGMPAGVFSLVQGPSVAVGLEIVRHPAIKAIGFTGSFRGGKAIFDAANQRPEPIPVYAEMGSTNPVFILPEALNSRTEQLAAGLKNSVVLGVGQFCTNPGLTVLAEAEARAAFVAATQSAFAESRSETMLTAGIQQAYQQGLEQLEAQDAVYTLARGTTGETGAPGLPQLMETSAQGFLADERLEKEVFGPSTLLVHAQSKTDLLDIAQRLEGHLTATLHGTEADLKAHTELISILKKKVGRLIINGFPTGVEVSHAMVHGGPFPATTDARMSSVGTTAITRFTRPICFQGFPDFLLPDELKADNPLNIWRLFDGNWSQ